MKVEMWSVVGVKGTCSNEVNLSYREEYDVFPTIVRGNLSKSHIIGEASIVTWTTYSIEYTVP